MKKIMALLLGCCCISAFADINAKNGFYLGGDLGVAEFEQLEGAAIMPLLGEQFILGGMDRTYRQIYLRPLIGYRFNDYWGLEASYNDIENTDDPADFPWGPDHYRFYFIDLAAKLIYPFYNGWSLFGKLGAAYVRQDAYNQEFIGTTPLVDSNKIEILPLVGLGTSFNFTQQFAMEAYIEWLPAHGPISNVFAAGMGLNYTL